MPTIDVLQGELERARIILQEIIPDQRLLDKQNPPYNRVILLEYQSLCEKYTRLNVSPNSREGRIDGPSAPCVYLRWDTQQFLKKLLEGATSPSAGREERAAV